MQTEKNRLFKCVTNSNTQYQVFLYLICNITYLYMILVSPIRLGDIPKSQ